MRIETLELIEEMIIQGDAVHQEAAILVPRVAGSEKKGDAIALALLAIDWRLRAFGILALEPHRPEEGAAS